VYSPQGSERFTDLTSRLARQLSGGFIRRIFYPPYLWRSGGVFPVKVAAGREMETKHYL